MKTKLTERALYMSHIDDLYVQWVQKQEEELLQRIFGGLENCDCLYCKEDQQHPKLVPSISANLGKN